MDPDLFGSVDPDSESGGIKIKIEGKTDFNQQILGFFSQEIKFFKFEPKKVSLEV